jgi:two-component system, OmpR family, sensor histidine kinase KdpD
VSEEARASHAKALEQSERLKSALLDAVTHDLRTPLTSIKASVTTPLEDFRSGADAEESVALDEEGRGEMLEVIDEEGAPEGARLLRAGGKDGREAAHTDR